MNTHPKCIIPPNHSLSSSYTLCQVASRPLFVSVCPCHPKSFRSVELTFCPIQAKDLTENCFAVPIHAGSHLSSINFGEPKISNFIRNFLFCFGLCWYGWYIPRKFCPIWAKSSHGVQLYFLPIMGKKSIRFHETPYSTGLLRRWYLLHVMGNGLLWHRVTLKKSKIIRNFFIFSGLHWWRG